MTVDVAATYGFGRWVDDHYEIDRALTDTPVLRCKRCHAEVGWLTRHAVERHGDDIVIMPLTRGKRAADYAY